MKYQPAGKGKEKLDGIGGHIPAEDSRNPWATLARGLNRDSNTGKRRRWAADTLGATPPRDGPFAMGAADVAMHMPPKTRVRRAGSAGGMFGPVKR